MLAVIDLVSIIFWLATALALLPLYAIANGKRPLILGNMGIIVALGVGIVVTRANDDGTLPRLLVRLALTTCLFVPVVILLTRRTPHPPAPTDVDFERAETVYGIYRSTYRTFLSGNPIPPWSELPDPAQQAVVNAIAIVRQVTAEDVDK